MKPRKPSKLAQRHNTKRHAETVGTELPVTHLIDSLPIPFIPPSSIPKRKPAPAVTQAESANRRISSDASIVLMEASRAFTAELQLAGLPTTYGPHGRKILDSLSTFRRKKNMVEVAVRGWQALQTAEKNAQSGKWPELASEAIILGTCIGELRTLNKFGASRRLSNAQQTAMHRQEQRMDDAFIRFAKSSMNSKGQFDAQSACEFYGSGELSLMNDNTRRNQLSTWRRGLPKDADLSTPEGRRNLAKTLKTSRFSKRYPLAGC